MKARNTLFSFILIAAAVGGSVYGVKWWDVRRHLVSTDNAYVHSSLTVVSARIDGYIDAVHFQNNDPVRAGDVLVSFRAAPFEAEVDAALAEVAAAEAEVETGRAAVENLRARRRLQQSLIAQAEARLRAMRAQAENTGRELSRAQELLDRGIGTRQKFEQALTTDQMARADVQRGEAELAAARDELPVIDSEIRRLETDIDRLRAMVARARSRLDRTEIALSDTLIIAPVDGIIGNRKVEPGMYTEAGWPMMSVVPLAYTWVEANLKETQLERVRIGQTAVLEIDAFPDQRLIGRVDSLAPASAAEFSLLPPQNATGNFIKVVQRIPVKITYDLPPELIGRLVPGMSVVVTIDTRTAPDGTALAAAAAPMDQQDRR